MRRLIVAVVATVTVVSALTAAPATAGAPSGDTTPPLITLPADITESNDPGLCGAVVSFAGGSGFENFFMISSETGGNATIATAGGYSKVSSFDRQVQLARRIEPMRIGGGSAH